MEAVTSASAADSAGISRSTSVWPPPNSDPITANIDWSRLNTTLDVAGRAGERAGETQPMSEDPSTSTRAQDTPENSQSAPNSTLQSYNLFCATCHPSVKERHTYFMPSRTPDPDLFPLGGSDTLLHTRAISTDRRVWLAKSRGIQRSVVPLEEQYFVHRQVDGLQVNIHRPCECMRQGIGCSTCGSPLGTRTTFCSTASISASRSRTMQDLEHLRARGYHLTFVSPSLVPEPTSNYHLDQMLSPSEAQILTYAPETRSLYEIDNMYPQHMKARAIPNVNSTSVYMFFADAVISTPAVVLSLPLNDPPTGNWPPMAVEPTSFIPEDRWPSSSPSPEGELPVPPRSPNQPSVISRSADSSPPGSQLSASPRLAQQLAAIDDFSATSVEDDDDDYDYVGMPPLEDVTDSEDDNSERELRHERLIRALPPGTVILTIPNESSIYSAVTNYHNT
ncbi:hypothetical protein BDP27DRAFT_1317428 [Rhodocollybia butyracea]|uniref:Uncharacterized protein n=1 Tax=Rhodocollybia butyracea TaxID=206335 RepID=A0A9P5UDF3_9AGAR|nr:hypothetical protein BDP27DRAFT_1317428 [Rhodocollybia butyracea]